MRYKDDTYYNRFHKVKNELAVAHPLEAGEKNVRSCMHNNTISNRCLVLIYISISMTSDKKNSRWTF